MRTAAKKTAVVRAAIEQAFYPLLVIRQAINSQCQPDVLLHFEGLRVEELFGIAKQFCRVELVFQFIDHFFGELDQVTRSGQSLFPFLEVDIARLTGFPLFQLALNPRHSFLIVSRQSNQVIGTVQFFAGTLKDRPAISMSPRFSFTAFANNASTLASVIFSSVLP